MFENLELTVGIHPHGEQFVEPLLRTGRFEPLERTDDGGNRQRLLVGAGFIASDRGTKFGNEGVSDDPKAAFSN
jgi:hypothetical protein